MNSVLRAVTAAALLFPVFADVAGAQTRLFTISGTSLNEHDPATGSLIASTAITPNPGTIGALAYDAATGTMFLSSTGNDNLWTLDITTGVVTLVGLYNVGTTVVMHGLEVDDTGQLYGYSTNAASGARFFSIDRNTGQATPISDPGFGGFGSLGFVASTQTMYLSDTTTDVLYTIDRTTGAATLVGPFGIAGSIGNGLAYDPVYGMYASNNSGTSGIYTIDLTTGAATFLAPLSGNPLSIAFVGSSNTPYTPFCFGDGTGTACPCANNGGTGRGCANSVNPAGGELTASGIASLANDTWVLSGSGVPNGPGLYFQGPNQLGGGAGVLFGDGLRCIGGSPVIRLGIVSATGNASTYPSGVVPPNNVRISVKGFAVAGTALNYQLWYRDSDTQFCNPQVFNLTNALTVTWAP